MSKQDFEDEERHAIWIVHGKKCFWHKEPVAYDVMEIDHIIPQTIKAKDLDEIKILYGLPTDFDVTEYRNLVPSCRRCNGDKGAQLVRSKAPIIKFHLQNAESKAPIIAKEYEKLANGNILSVIRTSLRSGLKMGIPNATLFEMLEGESQRYQAISTLSNSATAMSISVRNPSAIQTVTYSQVAGTIFDSPPAANVLEPSNKPGFRPKRTSKHAKGRK